MPSESYVKNWERTNKWLQENAPDYVIECIKELTDIIKDGNETIIKLKQVSGNLKSIAKSLSEKNKL